MNPPSGLAIRLLSVVFALILFGCATGPPPKRVVLKSEMTFSEDYDRVWAAVLDTLDQRGFVIAQMAKDDGYITTDRLEGNTKRKKVSMRLFRDGDSVRVIVDSYEERRMSDKDTVTGAVYFYWSGRGRNRYLEHYIIEEVAERLGVRP